MPSPHTLPSADSASVLVQKCCWSPRWWLWGWKGEHRPLPGCLPYILIVTICLLPLWFSYSSYQKLVVIFQIKPLPPEPFSWRFSWSLTVTQRATSFNISGYCDQIYSSQEHLRRAKGIALYSASVMGTGTGYRMSLMEGYCLAPNCVFKFLLMWLHSQNGKSPGSWL